MARSSRSTRRNRRGDGSYQAPAAASSRRRDRAQQVRPTERTKSQTGQQREKRGGFRAFAGESYAELRKVEWPSKRQLVSATVVVLIAIAVVGAYLAVADFAFSRLVRDVLLNI
jgi:preprotein translocase subunit SecE